MSKHKYINYFVSFMSLAIVFYYFFNSYSKTIKDQEDIIEDFTVSWNQEQEILNKITNIENRIFKRDSFDGDFISLEDCEKGSQLAIKDAKNKIYKLYTFGLPMIPTTEEYRFERYYEDLLKSKYGISTEHLGCTVSKEMECYRNKMEGLIKVEFGATIFEQTRKEARALFKKHD